MIENGGLGPLFFISVKDELRRKNVKLFEEGVEKKVKKKILEGRRMESLDREERMYIREQSKLIAEMMYENPLPEQVGYIRNHKIMERLLFWKDINPHLFRRRNENIGKRKKRKWRRDSPLKECISTIE